MEKNRMPNNDFMYAANDARHCGMYVGKSLFGHMMDHSDDGYQ
jgi:hypothetical protein